MRYLKFVIEHYKGIKGKAVIDLTHLPHSSIFTLVGLNESGKTSVLEAINLLQNEIEPSKAYRFIHIADKSNYNDSVNVSATLELDENDEKRIAEYCEKEFDFRLTQPIRIVTMEKVIKFSESQYENTTTYWTIPLIGRKKGGRVDRELRQVDIKQWEQVVDYVEQNFPRILYYENFLFEFPEKIYISINANAAKADSVSRDNGRYKEVIQDILDSFDNNLDLEKHIVKRFNSHEEQDRSALAATISDMETKLTDVIMGSWGDVFANSGDEVTVDLNEDSVGIYFKMSIKQGGSKYDISERSLGFRWFFSFLLFTQFRKERKDEFGETLFLLDEPASNLHQKSQQNLLRVFEKLSEDCKIIYSTHSHYMIDPKNLPGTYIVQNNAINYERESAFCKKNTEVQVYPYRQFASTHQNETVHYQPILEALDYVPSYIELIDEMIFLEGKNDYYSCKLAARYLGEEPAAMHFYPGASVDKYDPMLRLYLAWGKNFIAVFDDDQAGRSAQKKYKDQLGPDVEDRIFTLSDINEKWKGFTTEGLFTESDKTKLIKKYFENDEGYSKGRFNTAIQQLYISEDEYEFEEETLMNFRQLFDAMKSLMKAASEH